MEHDDSPHAALIRAVARRVGVLLDGPQAALTALHVDAVLSWSATTSLVRFASVEELLLRHFAEAWLAARLLPQSGASDQLRALDIGSGGGFPALPMHVLRPDVALTLLEPRARKAAFLRAVARHHALPRPSVLESRLEDLPFAEPWDVVTHRGIALAPERVWERLAPGGLAIRFPGANDKEGASWDRAGLEVVARVTLPTSPLVAEARARTSRTAK